MNNNSILLLVILMILSCNNLNTKGRTNEEEIEKPHTQIWYDTLIINYIRNSDNELIKLALKNNGQVDWILDRTEKTDTTNFYIFKQIKEFNINVSTIARGISVGDELEFADEVTLGRSLLHRIPFESSIKSM